MTQEEYKNAFNDLRAEVKNLPDRELLEQLYILIKINTMSIVYSNSTTSDIMTSFTNPHINSQFGNL